MRKYCAYQDRCHSEVRTRLLEHQVYGQDLEEIIATLITEKFLDEERFARSYARGKFNIKKWGRIKIRQQLKFKKVSEYCIKKGMQEIDEVLYFETLQHVIQKKKRSLSVKGYPLRQKLFSYAMQRGYESQLINEVLNQEDLG